MTYSAKTIQKSMAITVMAAASSLGWMSCTNRPTEIVAGATTQIRVPDFLKTVGVVVQLGGQVKHCDAFPVVDGSVTLPSTLGVIPPSDADAAPSEAVTVHILGFRSEQPRFLTDCLVTPDTGEDDVFVVRRRRVTYVENKIAYLPLPLRESCSDVSCAPDQTCIGGGCEPIDVDPATLQAYRDEFVFGDTFTCFSVGLCMDEGTLLPVALENADDCTFKAFFPPGVDPIDGVIGNLNVRIVYDTFGVEILDVDPMEGFIPDNDDPFKFKLAPNMCEHVYKKGRIASLKAGVLCPAKTPLQPICTEDLKNIQNGSYGTSGTVGNDFCSYTGATLQPVESALYVLFDNSQSMAQYFGPDGLSFAVETGIDNPIAARTKVAFDFMLPRTGCMDFPPNATVGFGAVDDVREPIGNELNNLGNVQANDPALFMHPAMTFAYNELAAHQSEKGTSNASDFNRRALVVIGNRDFEPMACGPDSPTLAADALANDGLHTYVVGLPPPTAGQNVTADGSAIATAGGTTFFDATSNEAEALKAFGDVVNDLGSCLYEPPPASVFTDQLLPDPAKLSYLDPITGARIDITRDTACLDGASSANGYHQDGAGSPIRVCGAACDALRQTLSDTAILYGASMQKAPNIPIQVSVRCDQLTTIQAGNP